MSAPSKPELIAVERVRLQRLSRLKSRAWFVYLASFGLCGAYLIADPLSPNATVTRILGVIAIISVIAVGVVAFLVAWPNARLMTNTMLRIDELEGSKKLRPRSYYFDLDLEHDHSSVRPPKKGSLLSVDKPKDGEEVGRPRSPLDPVPSKHSVTFNLLAYFLSVIMIALMAWGLLGSMVTSRADGRVVDLAVDADELVIFASCVRTLNVAVDSHLIEVDDVVLPALRDAWTRAIDASDVGGGFFERSGLQACDDATTTALQILSTGVVATVDE